MMNIPLSGVDRQCHSAMHILSLVQGFSTEPCTPLVGHSAFWGGHE